MAALLTLGLTALLAARQGGVSVVYYMPRVITDMPSRLFCSFPNADCIT